VGFAGKPAGPRSSGDPRLQDFKGCTWGLARKIPGCQVPLLASRGEAPLCRNVELDPATGEWLFPAVLPVDLDLEQSNLADQFFLTYLVGGILPRYAGVSRTGTGD
jgi:hypothetical protein